jgi:hypothetical protein
MLSRRICVAVCVVLLAAACGSSGGTSKPTSSTPTSTKPTANPDGTTLMGTTLAIGKRATVRYRVNPRRASVLAIRVVGVHHGRLRDLRGFTLGPRARSSSVYYARVKVRNVGNGDLGGRRLALYAKVTDSLVVPPVSFGSAFPRCRDPHLHRPFRKNAQATLCMVFLAPRHGKVTQIQWRIPSSPNAISWALHR